MSQKILIVDDEADVVELVSFNLKNAGFSVVSASDGNAALQMAREHVPSLIILDIMMPVMDGTETCKFLKKDALTAPIPVIMLTAKGETVDKILGLELGADDYITKPFSPRELVLRVKSILKRRGAEKIEDTLTVGEITLDRARHEVFIKGKPIVLTATEFKLLSLLIERKGRVQSRERLLQDVWDYSSSVDTRTVDTHVRRLRKKLGKNAKLIETTRGVGYRVLDPV
ncbi:response regulator [Kamptonema cortianum]|nr:response regulator [Oscillatoria laete-virens]MDK3157933.1 response regulator [Kamptonema cortianum]MDL5046061.1 response regulator [Oscillatoria amoena NRMC-F 0135]MDL5052768.1 response regulator [Oscillatoria laete-virens NRMC-F 0139]